MPAETGIRLQPSVLHLLKKVKAATAVMGVFLGENTLIQSNAPENAAAADQRSMLLS